MNPELVLITQYTFMVAFVGMLGGTLYFSNNYRRFRLDEASISAFARIEDIGAETIPPDFARNPRIHRAWRLRAA